MMSATFYSSFSYIYSFYPSLAPSSKMQVCIFLLEHQIFPPYMSYVHIVLQILIPA